MFTSLDVFKLAHAMASHAGQRQALVAQNVANSDTPGYRARDLPAFAETYQSPSFATGLIATRDSHLFGQSQGQQPRAIETPGPASANGNTVTIESQMLQAVDVKRQHDRAMAIYKSSLTILRSSISRQS